MLLVFPGATYPVAGNPVSVTSRLEYMSRRPRKQLSKRPAPRSALEILLVSRQVHDEAIGLFYHNDFVFPTHSRLQLFLFSLYENGKRMGNLTSLTISSEHGILVETVKKQGPRVDVQRPYIAHERCGQKALEGVDKMQVTTLLIRLLPNLRKLHFLHRSKTLCDHENSRCRGGVAFDFASAGFMFNMRNIADTKVRDIDMEIQEDEVKLAHEKKLRRDASISSSYLQRHEHVSRNFCHKKAALQHYNRGIQLAQKGVVVRELVTNDDWPKLVVWPQLEGSDCGRDKGCSCGPSDGKTEETQEVSHH